MRFRTTFITIILLALYALFLAHPINLATADLGRHLRNGQELLQNGDLVQTNFYSYTHPDFPTTNHHWGSGALFYLIFKAGGFAATHLFFIAIAAAAFFIFYRIGGNPWVALLAIPLLGERAEVRPEIFSYLFAGIFFWILLNKRYLWALPPLMILWVNSHIYFFLGIALIGAFWIVSFFPSSPLAGEESKVRGNLSLALLGSTIASLFNPFFFRGAIAPFTLWQNYGYRLAENQTLWNIQRLLPGNPNYLIFKLVLAVLILSFIYRYWKQKQVDWALLLVASGISIMGLLQLRNFTLFGLFALAIAGVNFATSPHSPPREEGTKGRLLWPLVITTMVFLLALSGELKSLFPQLQNYRLGLAPGIENAAAYFKNNNLRGPILNNYDIGGYLIYELAGERVFVDNRPEAYPASFFREEYIPMQQDETKWQAVLAKYQFNTIFFWWRDYTEWGQEFLQRRLNDSQWKQVYVDDYAIIFIRS